MVRELDLAIAFTTWDYWMNWRRLKRRIGYVSRSRLVGEVVGRGSRSATPNRWRQTDKQTTQKHRDRELVDPNTTSSHSVVQSSGFRRLDLLVHGFPSFFLFSALPSARTVALPCLDEMWVVVGHAKKGSYLGWWSGFAIILHQVHCCHLVDCKHFCWVSGNTFCSYNVT